MNKHNGHGQSWPNWSERLFSNGKLTSAISAAARASWPATELPTKRIWSGFRLWTIPFRPLSSNVFAPWHLERKEKKKKKRPRRVFLLLEQCVQKWQSNHKRHISFTEDNWIKESFALTEKNTADELTESFLKLEGLELDFAVGISYPAR